MKIKKTADLTVNLQRTEVTISHCFGMSMMPVTIANCRS